MSKRKENLILAILWSIVLICQFIEVILGTFQPSKLDVFCPLALLVLEYWANYLWGNER